MHLHLLQPSDLNHFRDLMNIFARAFEDDENYLNHKADDQYISQFLEDQSHLVLVALDEQENVIGGLVAYELQKFEQARKEIFVYDLAVSAEHRRKGIGRALLNELKNIAKQRGAYLIFVLAEDEDPEAIAFYQSIADREEGARQFTLNSQIPPKS